MFGCRLKAAADLLLLSDNKHTHTSSRMLYSCECVCVLVFKMVKAKCVYHWRSRVINEYLVFVVFVFEAAVFPDSMMLFRCFSFCVHSVCLGLFFCGFSPTFQVYSINLKLDNLWNHLALKVRCFRPFQTIYKDGRRVSTSSHCTKMKPKYPGYSWHQQVCAVVIRGWSRGIDDWHVCASAIMFLQIDSHHCGWPQDKNAWCVWNSGLWFH